MWPSARQTQHKGEHGGFNFWHPGVNHKVEGGGKQTGDASAACSAWRRMTETVGDGLGTTGLRKIDPNCSLEQGRLSQLVRGQDGPVLL